ncbi:amidohydrolase family protein [Arthrobacter sp. 35W]|uniref:amidohydrolase family protein n=1 Tax=Arthrobacter sp. 35W TaxID=1132441 RepID=UPI003FA4283C
MQPRAQPRDQDLQPEVEGVLPALLRRAGVAKGDAGAVLGLGSDWPIAPFEPLPILAEAQLRRRAGHPDQAPVLPGQALTALQALEGYTSHAARAAGQWDVSGSITVGKRADFTAFELDPLTAAPDELAASAVLGTIVDGRIQSMLDRIG